MLPHKAFHVLVLVLRISVFTKQILDEPAEEAEDAVEVEAEEPVDSADTADEVEVEAEVESEAAPDDAGAEDVVVEEVRE